MVVIRPGTGTILHLVNYLVLLGFAGFKQTLMTTAKQ